MFNTLESTWDRSARRGWTTVASFGFQALALSLLLAVPFVWIQGPPRIAWLRTITAPITQSEQPQPPQEFPHGHYTAGSVSNIWNHQLVQPQRIPRVTNLFNDDTQGPPAPNLPDIDFGPNAKNAVPDSLRVGIPTVLPRVAPPPRPLKISHRSEGDLIYKVQPVYPSIAREARIQGPVELRAIVSKMGTIEKLAVISGHPLLARAAVDAVKQWRYRPYLLNDEPIEVDMEISVNFVLSQ